VTRFDDGYETIAYLPGGTGPPVTLRSTAEAFEQTLLGLDTAVPRPIPTGLPNFALTRAGASPPRTWSWSWANKTSARPSFLSQMGWNIAPWASQ
jgi:hypothetical protein